MAIAGTSFDCTRNASRRAGLVELATERIGGTDRLSAFNIVILGDGFTQALMPDYHTAATQFADKLLSVAPFRAMADTISVHRVDVVSNEAGVDVPGPADCNGYDFEHPPGWNTVGSNADQWSRKAGVYKDTALGTTWCDSVEHQYKFLDSTNWGAVLNAASSAGVYPHLIIVLVNDWFSGAAAWAQDPLGIGNGGVAFVSIRRNLTGETHPRSTSTVLVPQYAAGYPDVAVHELGHLGPFLLKDEYGHVPGAIPNADGIAIDNSPNLTRNTTPPLKWESLRTPGAALPTRCPTTLPPDVALSVKGGGYSEGVYHARCECRMNQFYSETFCPVCRQRVIDRLAAFAPLWNVRVILDSVRLLAAPSGSYFVEYTVTSGSQSFNGRWPNAPTDAALTTNVTAEPGELLLDIPVPLMWGPTSTKVDYKLMRRDTSGGVILLYAASVVMNNPYSSSGQLFKFETASHRIVFALARR